jgi:hypothetical protein|tara:strand:+ start:1546 stop:1944 length:399 start_codon:yes stop_codon:yes gene_type:complete
MATTTASITLASSDLVDGMAMNYYKTATLNKAGTSTGLEKIQTGTREYLATGAVELLDESVVTTSGANKVYIKNLSTDATEYFEVAIQAEVLGRLYAGDWMFIPWSAGGSNNITVNPSVATSMKIEYVVVHE